MRARILLGAVLLAGTAGGCAPKSTMQRSATPTVTLLPAGAPPVRVRVEVAKTPAQRERGLMYRERLDPDAGMIFIFDRDEDQSFWMKNTVIPLDMIFITRDLVVTGVVADATPFSLDSLTCGRPSRYVLEVNGGFAARHRIAAGTPVELKNLE